MKMQSTKWMTCEGLNWLAAGLLAALLAGCATGPMAPLSESSASSMPRNMPQERPGLATGWGDEMKSRVSGVEFRRASSKPAGTDTIWYNDREGLKAMGGRTWKVGPMQTAAGGMVEWGIKGKFGWLPAYKSEYWGGKRFVEGRKGSTYSIVAKNLCRSRLEIVVSVDGLDVMDGTTASFRKRGYIIDPGKTLTIKGFRTGTDTVAAFKFSSVANSYANMKHGDTRNVGVAGLAVFTEKNVDPWKWMPVEVGRRESARAFAKAP